MRLFAFEGYCCSPIRSGAGHCARLAAAHASSLYRMCAESRMDGAKSIHGGAEMCCAVESVHNLPQQLNTGRVISESSATDTTRPSPSFRPTQTACCYCHENYQGSVRHVVGWFFLGWLVPLPLVAGCPSSSSLPPPACRLLACRFSTPGCRPSPSCWLRAADTLIVAFEQQRRVCWRDA